MNWESIELNYLSMQGKIKTSLKIYITKAKFVVGTSNVREEVWIRDG